MGDLCLQKDVGCSNEMVYSVIHPIHPLCNIYV